MTSIESDYIHDDDVMHPLNSTNDDSDEDEDSVWCHEEFNWVTFAISPASQNHLMLSSMQRWWQWQRWQWLCLKTTWHCLNCNDDDDDLNRDDDSKRAGDDNNNNVDSGDDSNSADDDNDYDVDNCEDDCDDRYDDSDEDWQNDTVEDLESESRRVNEWEKWEQRYKLCFAFLVDF